MYPTCVSSKLCEFILIDNNALWPIFAFCVYKELFRHNVNIGNTIRFLFSDIVSAEKVSKLLLSTLSRRCRMQENVWLGRLSTNWTSLATASSPSMMFAESMMSRCLSWGNSPDFQLNKEIKSYLGKWEKMISKTICPRTFGEKARLIFQGYIDCGVVNSSKHASKYGTC